MELVMASLVDWFTQIWNLIKYTTIIQFGSYHLSVLDVAIWLFILDVVADFIINLLNFSAGEAVRSSYKFIKPRVLETRSQREYRIARKDLKKRGLIK